MFCTVGKEEKMDEIRITDLAVYAHHGVFAEENKLGQTFYVSAVLYTETRRAGLEDDLTLSTNYGEVCHFITEWMQKHTCSLIEAAAEQLALELLLGFELIKELSLEIKKPQAPIGLPFGCVSVSIRRGWHRVYLSVGSNMGDSREYIRQAAESLKAERMIRFKGQSELLWTKPYGGVKQQDFLNGAIAIDTLLSPDELLAFLHTIEAAAGRQRVQHWGPRTLDLDIIFYDKLIYETDELIIPHIDMENRYFVLKPLSELAPNYRHPILQSTVLQLLEKVENDSKTLHTDR